MTAAGYLNGADNPLNYLVNDSQLQLGASPERKISRSETIHSGHFMISELDEDEKEAQAVAALDEAEYEQPKSLSPVQSPQYALEPTGESEATQKYVFGPACSRIVTIDAPLSKLFECMTLAYSGTLTSPKWKTFKGLRLKLKDKIRLNNIIWRAWHIQYVIGGSKMSSVCKFAITLDMHNKPEAQVMEGKYWKRRATTVTAEYKKWRLYYKDMLTNKLPKAKRRSESQSELFQCSNSMPGFDDDFLDFSDTLFSSILPNMIDFPNPREIARSGCGADFIQPGLTQLQPPFDDFMDFPLQDLIMSSKAMMPLPPVPEDTELNLGQKSLPVKQETSMQSYGGNLKYNMPVYQQNLVDNTYQRSVDVFQTSTGMYDGNNCLSDPSVILNPIVTQSSQIPVQKEQTYISEQQTQQPTYASYQTVNDTSPGMQMMNSSYRNAQYAPYTTSPPTVEGTQVQPRTVSAGKNQFAVPTNRPVKRRSRSASGSNSARGATTSVSIAPLSTENLLTISNHQIAERTNSLPMYGAVQSRQNRCAARSNQVPSVETSPTMGQNFEPPLTPQYNQPTSPIITTSNYSSESNSLIAQLLSANPMPAQTNMATSSASTSPQSFNSSRQYAATVPQQYNNFLSSMPPRHSNVSGLRSMDDLTFLGPKAPIRKISSPARIGSPYISPVHSKSAATMSSQLSAHQALFGAASVKPIKSKSDQEKIQYKEHRRVCHINAEQKRRCNIKNGFDTLRDILPSMSQNTSTKISKAAMLQKAAERIRALQVDRQQQQDEYDHLKQEIENLNQSINVFQSQLPVTGAPIACQRTGQTKEMFDKYVSERTQQNWKFWIFSIIMEPLLESYDNTIATSSYDEMCKSMMRWLDQSCCLTTLRRDCLNSLRHLSTTTNILTNPASLPEEAITAVLKKKE